MLTYIEPDNVSGSRARMVFYSEQAAIDDMRSLQEVSVFEYSDENCLLDFEALHWAKRTSSNSIRISTEHFMVEEWA